MKRIALLVTAALVLAGCTSVASNRPLGSVSTPADTSFNPDTFTPDDTFTEDTSAVGQTTVLYEVTSDQGISSVDYSTANFGQEQDTSVHGNSWSRTVTDTGDSGFSVWVLEAQNAGSGGKITCKITVNGTVVANQTSNGAYAVVMCTSSGS
jgi:hypothetical protein